MSALLPNPPAVRLRNRVGRWLLNNVVAKVFGFPVRWQIARFDGLASQPRQAQDAVLAKIVARQSATQFGRDHHFGAIRTIDDYRRNVDVQDYASLEPYIAQMRQGRFDALVAGEPVIMFALTSGTTAARKFIPVTPRYLKAYRRGWNMWGLRTFRDHPEVKLRPIVQLSSDWDEFRTEAGIPCGAVTGLTATSQKRVIRWLYSIPAEASKIKDTAAKQYLALRLSLLSHPGMMIAANPSTLINLARHGDHEKQSLIRDIFDGGLSPRFEIPSAIRKALARRLGKRHPDRARELEDIVNRTGTLLPKDYWPRPLLLGNWTGGSVGAYLRQYPRYFGNVFVRDVGLIASEGRMTIPTQDGSPGGVLDIQSHFFEFIPEAEMDSAQPTVLSAHEIVEGATYSILLTTDYGLYRYHIHDVVRVVGFHQATPMLEFLSKGSHYSSVTGEKLSEYHVTGAMLKLVHELDLHLSAYTLAPHWDEDLPYYSLLVDSTEVGEDGKSAELARRLDECLKSVNIEYASKRDSLRLGPIRTALLPAGTWSHWDRERLAKSGGSPEQYKHPCLIGDLSFRETMPIVREVGESAN